ncbi:hypothetical protein [Bordetella holmesii]|nr:hypothetical protein [Bordetella holmesii]QGB16049.1 hypothetical protein FYB57_16055 [Bordetella holmesii]QGB65295.1 hypothetical protein FYB43_16050 [Bordetella holmesii]QGC43847.1 hypothetical protein FYB19_16060 [Bordetella holmesii]QGC63758.1 hypothetical protein FYB13_16050 [Bordetella holmesii]QGD12926.1 hypothetical protein FYA98_16040 [Bordetella holmesii]
MERYSPERSVADGAPTATDPPGMRVKAVNTSTPSRVIVCSMPSVPSLTACIRLGVDALPT